jgi:hypothetical protein
MIRCHSCVTSWVDRAVGLAGVELDDVARRRLIAALLSRPHLILSGPPGIGKEQLIRALALAGVDGQRDRICRLQGHPWWATDTADIGRFVELQTDFSLWRLAYFAHSVVDGPAKATQGTETGPGRRASHNRKKVQSAASVCAYIACIERISPVEIELYFRVVAQWLVRNSKGASRSVPLRLLGTFDGTGSPDLDDQVLQATALVHLSDALDFVPRDIRPDANASSRALA